MKTTKFKFTDWVILKYDARWPEFRKAFEAFENAQPEGRTKRVTNVEFLEHVAGHLTEDGHHLRELSATDFIDEEPIGYVWLEGGKRPGNWCGVIVVPGYNGRHTVELKSSALAEGFSPRN